MKLIEALKKIKVLKKKAEDLRDLVHEHCAVSSIQTPMYADNAAKVREWIQGHSDILKEILRLRTAIKRTNLATELTIEIDGKKVMKTIAEWVDRRRELVVLELQMWEALWDKRIKEGVYDGPAGASVEVKIVRFYSPEEKDRRRAELTAEPLNIDAALEIANATTELIEQ